MRIAITGGAGFIGSELVRAALAAGVEVAVLDDLSTGSAQNLTGLDVDFVQGSILDDEALAETLSGADSVVHLAALASVALSLRDPAATHLTNATGSLAVLEAARSAGVDHVVVASSSAVYGTNPALPIGEREWVRPMSPYGVSKLATEQYALAYQDSFGLATLAFRLFNVYGPRQAADHAYAAVVPAFLDALLDGRPVPLHGDGTQSRDFTYVGTVSRVLLESAVRRVSHSDPVNLAFGNNTDLNALLSLAQSLTGRVVEVTPLPSRAGDVKHSQADNSVLRSLFPGVAPVELPEGLAATIAWFEESKSARLQGVSTGTRTASTH